MESTISLEDLDKKFGYDATAISDMEKELLRIKDGKTISDLDDCLNDIIKPWIDRRVQTGNPQDNPIMNYFTAQMISKAYRIAADTARDIKSDLLIVYRSSQGFWESAAVNERILFTCDSDRKERSEYLRLRTL